MKKVKLMMMTLMMCLMAMVSFGQEREVKKVATINKTPTSTMEKAIGWLKNKDGEWLSLNNTIPVNVGSEYKSLIKHTDKGLGVDNFINYKFYNINYDNKEYICLVKKYKRGTFEYSSIRKGWYTWNSHIAYIFDKTYVDSLKFIDNKINLIKIPLVDVVGLDWKKDLEFLNLIPQKINWDRKPFYNLVFHVAPYKEKNIVQFQIYTTYGKYSDYSGWAISGIRKEHEIPDPEKSYRKLQIYMTDELFNHCYFETDYNNFNNFLTIDIE